MDIAEHHATGFGADWVADIALDGFDPIVPDAGRADAVRVRRVAALTDRGPGRTVNRGLLFADGLRLAWDNEVTFDMIDGQRIDYLPGPGWRGALPAIFYGSIAALTLAWRGAIPFHACAVEVGGCTVLIAGTSGAGKSTLTAGLLALGTRLVADDLAVVRVANGRVMVARGRPTMRQHADTAAGVEADLCQAIPDDPRGKWLVRPRRRIDADALPLGGLLVLGEQPVAGDAEARLSLLAAQLFRPRWLATLPNQVARRRDLLTIAATLPVAGFPAIGAFDADARHARAVRALAAIRALAQLHEGKAGGRGIG